MAITTKDLAKISGYSLGTVDRAVNDRPGINRLTKEKILKLAKELGYTPDLRARSLVNGKTMTIGVVIFDMGIRFFSQLVFAMQTEAKKQGYMLYVIYTQKNKDDEKQALTQLKSLNVDGIILLPLGEGKPFENFLKSLQIPLITIANKVNGWPLISFKSFEIIYKSVQFIVNHGYQHVIYLSPPLSLKGQLNIYEVNRRLKGYKKAVREISSLKKPIVIDQKDFKKQLDQFSFAPSEKSAILCSSDVYALEVIEYFRERKIPIRDQVGVMGIDNVDILKFIHPKLTTVDLHLDELGAQAVKGLIDLISQKQTTMDDVFLDCQIIEGETI